MTHLGSRVTALADGQLGPQEAERALAHVAGCPRCAEDLATARMARRALTSASDVEPTAELTARLLALSAQIPSSAGGALRGGPVREDPWCAPEPPTLPRPGAALTGEVVAGHPVRRRVLAVAAGGVGMLAVGLFVLGEGPVVTPSLHPADPLTALARAGDGGVGLGTQVAVVDTDQGSALGWMERQGWACPSGLPAGFEVADVRVESGGSVLELDLTSDGTYADVVVREQVGRLDAAALSGLPTWEIDGRTVHVVSTEPWHVVWQSGSTVVDIVAEADESTVAQLVATFPDQDYDSGVPARILRGWTTMTGAFGTP